MPLVAVIDLSVNAASAGTEVGVCVESARRTRVSVGVLDLHPDDILNTKRRIYTALPHFE